METTISFELPVGIERDGSLHKKVIMRRLTGEDTKAVLGDHRTKELEEKQIDITSVNPVRQMKAQAALDTMYNMTLAKVTKSIGEITDINVDLMDKLCYEDRAHLLTEHFKLNNMIAASQEKTVPLAAGGK